MKITKLRAYQVDLPLKEGRYSWSNGNFVEEAPGLGVTPIMETIGNPVMEV